MADVLGPSSARGSDETIRALAGLDRGLPGRRVHELFPALARRVRGARGDRTCDAGESLLDDGTGRRSWRVCPAERLPDAATVGARGAASARRHTGATPGRVHDPTPRMHFICLTTLVGRRAELSRIVSARGCRR